MAPGSDDATGVRRLVLLRHAKSAWPDGVPDVRRPLNDRGRRDAPAAGQWLRDHVGTLDAVVCSPAQRTRETWALVAAELDAAPTAIFDDRIYAAEPEELLDVVRELPDTAGTALLIGHNPGVVELVELLGGQEREMRTASIAVLSWSGIWADAAEDGAQLDEHTTPRG
jgi:phosphohistidine phosphatase